MFLKSVELFGFKSFPDKVRIDFMKGISALLGPNGCGKSNIVDAIKWVLGEQATKTLRAERMEDVIFNGSDARKPLNVAEVTLHIVNAVGKLPLDLDEVAVKRRIFRGGESEYFINNNPVRLKDVRDLFLDTGIGKSAYSVMEQGKIDQILSNKPDERRYLFEEAAGITKYLVKSAEADRKLQKTEENIVQVGNILKEVKKNYDTLKTQSEKTEIYRKLKDEIFTIDVDLHLLRLRDFYDKKERQGRILKQHADTRDRLKDEIDNINDALEKEMDLVNNLESELIENQKHLYGIDVERNAKDTNVIILKERRSEHHHHIESIQERIHKQQEKLAGLNEQILLKEDDINKISKEIEDIQTNFGIFERSIETIRLRREENEKMRLMLRQKIAEMSRQNEDIRTDLQILIDELVRALDSQLESYSVTNKQAVESDLRDKIATAIRRFENRSAGLTDFLDFTDQIKTDEFRNKVKTTFGDCIVAMKQIEEELNNFFTLLPGFIDDFLSPQGFITKKRDFENRLKLNEEAIKKASMEDQSLRDENTHHAEKLEEYRKTLEELKVNRVKISTRQDALKESIRLFRREYSEIDLTISTAENEIESVREKIRLIEYKIGELEKERTVLNDSEKRLRSELTVLEKRIQGINKNLLSEEKVLKKQMFGLGSEQEKIEHLQIEVAQIETEIKNLYGNFSDIYGIDFSEYDSQVYEVRRTLPELKGLLAEDKEKLKNLGHVNLMAPEEFLEVKERFDFLQKQLNDLSKAREDLVTVTREIKRESTELFIENYEKIRRNFHTMFRRLFGGGRAELKLTEPDSVLVSGIEIFAQPPGKKLENITLLSGGEKSLTAVALLFATYMVKPSPFCILDKIDAALDEANVGRFITVLSEFGRQSQFIIITHNKKTVTGANALLGVTMEESGVSKIISVRLDEDG